MTASHRRPDPDPARRRTVSIYDHGKLHWRKRYFSDCPAVDGVVVVGTKGAATR